MGQMTVEQWYGTIKTGLTKKLTENKEALPAGFNQQRFILNCITVIQDMMKDDKKKAQLEKINPETIPVCLAKAAYLGLDFFNGECYAIPYGGNLTFQTDYKGEIKLCKRYSKNKLNAKDVYVRTLDMSQAMAENARLIKFEEQMEADRKRKAEEEERRRAEAEARAKEAEERRRQEAEKNAAERAEREKALAEQQAQEERASESGYNAPVPDKTADVQSEEPAEKPAEKEVLPEEKKYKATFYAIGTLQQLKDLQEYMKEHNIQFGKAGK